jgi:nitric oxide synthase-interacting protein
VTQKKDIQRQKEKIEAMKKESEEEKERAKEAARERVRLEFEKGHLRLASTPVLATTSGAESKEREHLIQNFLYVLLLKQTCLCRLARGTKRKFDLSTVETLAQEAEEAALRQIEHEQAEALRHKLPDFWLPSLTPTYTSNGPPTSYKDFKLQTTCRGGNPPHPLA